MTSKDAEKVLPLEAMANPRITLLVVEDSMDMAQKYRREVAGQFPVIVARGAADARAQLCVGTAITHVIVDGLHGDWLDVVHQVQEINSQLDHKIEVIVVSGATNIRDQVQAYGVRFVSKLNRPNVTAILR